jgi:hypothetical protein
MKSHKTALRANQLAVAETHPWTIEWWYKKKNGRLTPFDVSSHALELVFWKCPKGPDHVFAKSIRFMCHGKRRKNYCPYCLRKALSVTNSLTTVYPWLALELDTEHNPFTASEIIADGHAERGMSIHWKCSKCHFRWKSPLSRRIDGAGCPNCASLVSKSVA